MAVAITETGQMTDPDPYVPEWAARRTYTARYKLAILAEYDALERDAKGALLRREGLYTSLLSEWRKQRDKGALDALSHAPGRPPVDPLERGARAFATPWGRLPHDGEDSARGPRARRVVEARADPRRARGDGPPVGSEPLARRRRRSTIGVSSGNPCECQGG